MCDINFDQTDVLRFAPIALRQSTRKGYLDEIKKGNETERKFFALYGNLLYSFGKDGDPSSLLGLTFMESSKVKISSNLGKEVLSISTVGGKTIMLTGADPVVLQDWMQSIESNKVVAINRQLEDNEADTMQLNHRVEQQELQHQEHERAYVEVKRCLSELENEKEQIEAKLSAMELENQKIKAQLKATDNERLMLLRSRGITPKVLPLWALSEQPRGGVTEFIDHVKIWTGTWNLGSSEPFAGMDRQRAQRLLQPFVPSGYGIYVLGVQEGVSNSVFDCLGGLLEAEGCRRLRLDAINLLTGGVIDASTAGGANSRMSISRNSMSSVGTSLAGAAASGAAGGGQDGDLGKLYGRGDGSLLSSKFTGIAVYVHVDILPDVKLLSVASVPFTSVLSKGGVAVGLSVLNRSIAFVSTHFEAKHNDVRREQYQVLVKELGSKMAEHGYHLTDQFHHVIWCGDLNYKLIDTSGRNMPAETVVKMMQDGRLYRTLYDSHDQLNRERRDKLVFFGFREPTPFPNFFPTYKKIQNRPMVDYSKPSWVLQTYQVRYKEPFYKGGKTKDRPPAFTDRVLYHSMVDLAEDLVPECVPADMNVFLEADPAQQQLQQQQQQQRAGKRPASLARSRSATIGASRAGAAGVAAAGAGGSRSSDAADQSLPKSMTVMIDNYRSLNDGEGLTVSDHSPVFATFVLRLRHDFDGIVAAGARQRSTGDIGSVLDALMQEGGAAGSPVPPSASATAASKHKLEGGSDSCAVETIGTPITIQGVNSDDGDNIPTVTSTATNDNNTKQLQGTVAVDAAATVQAKLLKYSLLPPGMYQVRISNIRLVWGTSEEYPLAASLLFPAPYETVCGERFAEYRNEMICPPSAVSGQGADSDFLLSSVSSSVTPDGHHYPQHQHAVPASAPGSMRIQSGGLGRAQTLPHNAPMGQQQLGAAGARHSFQPGAAGAAAGVAAREALLHLNDTHQWQQIGPSKTGTCLSLGAHWRRSTAGPSAAQASAPNSPTSRSDAANGSKDGSEGLGSGGGKSKSKSKSKSKKKHKSSSRKDGADADEEDESRARKKPFAPLVLTWKGSEPLDKLHICLKASLRPFVFSADGSGRTEATGDGEDIMVGHCAIGLEQLCKVAMVSTGGISGSTDVTRILVNQGRPMCNIEATTLQREMVTLCCTLELLPPC